VCPSLVPAGLRADLIYQKNYLLLLLESVTGDRGWVAALAGAWAQRLKKVLLMARPDHGSTQSGGREVCSL